MGAGGRRGKGDLQQWNMGATGEKLIFRLFHVEIHLKIILSHLNQRDFKSSQPPHGRKKDILFRHLS